MEEIDELLSGKLIPINDPALQGNNAKSDAAVLILFVKKDGEWNIVYTRRANNVSTHQGEVSFPGGAYEDKDASLVQTALREAKEEIGIKPESVRIQGGLKPVRTISNYCVYPFIGLLDFLPDFVINLGEVERVFLIPVKWLMDEQNYYKKDHMIDSHAFKGVIHYHDYDDEHLWGLSAKITQEVLRKIK